MKVDTQELKGFQPVRVTLTLETEDELNALRCLSARANAVANYLRVGKPVTLQVQQLLEAIYQTWI